MLSRLANFDSLLAWVYYHPRNDRLSSYLRVNPPPNGPRFGPFTVSQKGPQSARARFGISFAPLVNLERGPTITVDANDNTNFFMGHTASLYFEDGSVSEDVTEPQETTSAKRPSSTVGWDWMADLDEMESSSTNDRHDSLPAHDDFFSPNTPATFDFAPNNAFARP